MDILNKISEKAKNSYYFFEDKWYDLLDKIDSKVPIYPIIDRVDAVIPSFILFLLILLFILILIGYFIQFTSPIDITFTTIDATNTNAISGVNIKTIALAQAGEGVTNSEGKYIFRVTDSSKNIYSIIGEMLFGKQDLDTEIEVTARKTGYVDFSDTFYEGNEHKLLLSPLPEDNDDDFPSETQVRLVDNITNLVITDNTGEAYIKFSCNNNNVASRTVTSTDGIFDLIEPNCQFKVEEAYSPGYIKNSSPRILPTNISLHSINLTRVNNTGRAKIRVYSDSNENNPVIGATVNIGEAYSSTTNNSGVATITNIIPGEYPILVTKTGYHTITEEDGLTIEITKGNETEEEVSMISIDPSLIRKVYLKVIDEVDGNLISNAKVVLRTISGTGYAQSYLNSKETDSNGIYQFSSLSTANEDKLVAVISKDGYVIEVVKPTLFTIEQNNPEIVYLKKSTALNSGKSEVNVKGKSEDLVKNLANATASIVATEILGIKNLTLFSKTTNTDGNASFFDLPKDINYFAQAEFENASGVSNNTLKLDANKTIYFNVIIDLDLSKIILNLKNKNMEVITDANVILYQADSTFSNLVFKEKLTLSSNKFSSGVYSKENNYLIKIESEIYASAFLTIDKTINKLSNGNNEFTKILTKLSEIDYEKDKNVAIMWGDIYKLSDPLWGEPISKISILDDKNTYRAQVNAFITKEGVDYNTLLKMIRTENAIIKNIYINPLMDKNKINTFSCSNSGEDNIKGQRSETYYLGSSTANCVLDEKIVAGAKWKETIINNYLEKGEYNLAIDFTIDLPTDQNEIIFYFRAKEENKINSSETSLKEKRIKVGVPFREGVFLNTKINSNTLLFNDNNASEIGVEANKLNNLEITIFNEKSTTLTNAKLTLFSYIGTNANFSETTTPNGEIIFSGGVKKYVLADNQTINAWSNKKFNVDFNFPKNYSESKIVVVFEYGVNKEIYFINVSTQGLRIRLISDDFLTGVYDQTFSGEIRPINNSLNPIIDKINIKIFKDGNTIPEHEIKLEETDSRIKDQTSFELILPGDYVIGDYLEITINAKESSSLEEYNPYFEKIDASSGGTQDRTLACIDIYQDTVNNQKVNEETQLVLGWEEETTLTIRNGCEENVKLFLETGLMCNYIEDSPFTCDHYKELEPDEEIKIKIKGQNFDFNPNQTTPNFTDRLGLFPVYIKAKFLDRSIFSTASIFSINLINNYECFSFVGWPKFDFSDDDSDKVVEIENYCFYRDINDYFVPELDLRSFGYVILPNENLTEEATINFDVDLEIDGAKRILIENTREIENRGAIYSIFASDLNGEKTINQPGGLTKYLVTFDLEEEVKSNNNLLNNWAHTDIQFRIIDNDESTENYGAKIDGDIKFTYLDNSTELVKAVGNFTINPFAKTGNAHVITGDEFFGEALEQIQAADGDWYGGIFYQQIDNNKQIKQIDINFIGNPTATNDYLSFGIWTGQKYSETYFTEGIEESEEPTILNLGNYTVPKMSGVKFIIASIKDLDDAGVFSSTEFREKINPNLERINTNNPNVLVWVENGFLLAKIIGQSPFVSQDEQTIINGKIQQIIGSGNIYGILNVTDFVQEKHPTRIISGDVKE